MTGRSSRIGTSLVLVPLAFSALVYLPIVRNYFFSDDFLNLFLIVDRHLPHYLLTPNGGHVLVARNAVFYAFHALFGLQPSLFFGAVLFTHLVNVYLLYRVIDELTRSARLACFGATMWGICPLHGGTLGWYAVYGHVMVATAFLLILYSAIRSSEPPSRTKLALWYLLALVAATSFGVGLGLAIALPFVLALLMPGWRRWSRSPPLVSLTAVIPALYFGLLWLYRAAFAGTTQIDAVLRLSSDNGMAILPAFARISAFGSSTLLAGPFPPLYPHSLTVTWLVAALLAALCLVALRWSSTSAKRQLAACGLMVLGSYGMIVLGRGFWLQNAPVEHLVGFSRYHYAALIPLTIAFCIVFAQFDRSAWFGARAGNVLLLAWLVCCGAAYLYQPLAIDHHAEARRQTSEAVEAIRKQIQAQPQGAAVFIRNRHFRPLPLPAVHFPGTAAAFVIFFPGNVVDGRPVYFVDRNPTVRAAFKGKRTTTLIVPPGSE